MRVKAFLDNAYRLIFARDVATSQPIFYCNSTTGSDSNNGLTAGTPFLTLPRAIDALTTIDCNGFDPVINLAAGNYDGLVTLKNVVGVANRVTIQGINGARTACKIRGTTTTAGGHSVIAASATPYRFKDVEIGINNNTADLYRKLILVQCPLLEFEDVCLRGTTTTDDFISAYSRSTIRFIGSLQVEGSARWFLDINGGFAYFTDNFAFSGNSSFTVFAHGSDFTVVCYASTIAGTHTGKRFEIIDGVLETYEAGDGLPGSTAGTNTYPGLSGSGSTDLSIGTHTSTTLDIVSSSGDDVTLPAATTTLSGLLTGADKAKLNDIQEGAINQTTADGRYRLQSANIPANEITGTFQDSQIPSSVARDSEVTAAVTAHETTFNHSTFATTTQLTNLRNEVGMIGDPLSNAPGTANTAAVITVAAPGAGQRLQVNQIEFSYNAAPTNGTLTIQQGSTVIKTLFVSAAGPGPIITGIRLAANTALTITLSAGGAGVTGSVNASVLQVAV